MTYPEDEFCWVDNYPPNDKSKMNWTNVKSALAMGLVTGVIAAIGYVLKVGDVFAVDVHGLVNCFALAGLTAISSFVTTSFLTTSRGNFLGAVNIKEVN